jgi:hypothetical protein
MTTRHIAPSAATALLGLTLLLPVQASAQTLTAGVKGGINIASMDFTDVSGITITPSRLVGATGGAFIGADFNHKGGLLVEVLYSRRGATEDFSESGFTYSNKITIDYIDVPVVGRVSLKGSEAVTVHLFVGPLFAFKLSDSQKATLNGQAVPIEPFVAKSYDVGLTFGMTVDIKRILVDARYSLGLIDINKNVEPGDPTVKNRTLSLMVGAKFK